MIILDNEPTKGKVLFIRLSPDTYKKIETPAKRLHRPLATLARQIIEHALTQGIRVRKPRAIGARSSRKRKR